jgi:hypothetical protein
LVLAAVCFAGVTVSSPASGSTVSSPVHFVAQGSTDVYAMKIYVDYNSVYSVSGYKIDTYVSLAGGNHSVTVQGWSTTGAIYKTPLTITVSGTTSTSTAPSGSSTYSNIDQMSGWQSCGACAGAGGNGPVGTYWMKQWVSSPSMDGASAEFYNGGKAWADALWWKQLGANGGVSHFVYDLYFYVNYPGNAQALEFDVNQSVNYKKYIFGTQCAIADGQWEVWNTAGKYWVKTGIACKAPPAYTWNHLTWEFQRVNGQVLFVAFTLNGVKSYINKYFYPISVSASELNVAFQMDLKGSGYGYNVWLDKVKLTVW